MPRQLRFFVRLVPVVLLLAASHVLAQQMVSVAGKEVYLRTGPGTRYAARWLLGHGFPLKVLGRHGSWLKVRDFENDTGWIYQPLTGRTPYHVVKAKIANLRSQPTTHSRILAKLAYGEGLRTLMHRKGWVKVRRDGGLIGWVARSLLWGW